MPIIKNQAVNLHTNCVNVLQRGSQFLVVLLLIFSMKIQAQQQLPRIEQNNSHALRFSGNFQSFPGDFRLKFFQSKFGFVNNIPGKKLEKWYRYMIDGNSGGPVYFISPVPLCNSSLPFFCKKEIQFENATSIPLRFRLGSLDYVNKLEGKQ